MVNYGIKRNIYSLIEEVLSNRRFKVTANGKFTNNSSMSKGKIDPQITLNEEVLSESEVEEYKMLSMIFDSILGDNISENLN